jgi:hypothetical protein
MVNTATTTMTFTDFTISNTAPVCADLTWFYEAYITTTYAKLPSFITFTRTTRTFSVYTTVAANAGIYSITVVGHAPDRARVESTFVLTVVAYDAACGPTCSMT